MCVCCVAPPTHRADRKAAEKAAQIDLRRYGRDDDSVKLEASSSSDQPKDEVGDGDEFCTLSMRRSKTSPDSEDNLLTPKLCKTFEFRAPPPPEDWDIREDLEC
jgi:hypothetical protein